MEYLTLIVEEYLYDRATFADGTVILADGDTSPYDTSRGWDAAMAYNRDHVLPDLAARHNEDLSAVKAKRAALRDATTVTRVERKVPQADSRRRNRVTMGNITYPDGTAVEVPIEDVENRINQHLERQHPLPRTPECLQRGGRWDQHDGVVLENGVTGHRTTHLSGTSATTSTNTAETTLFQAAMHELNMLGAQGWHLVHIREDQDPQVVRKRSGYESTAPTRVRYLLARTHDGTPHRPALTTTSGIADDADSMELALELD